MPTLPALFFAFNKLDSIGVDWVWHVVEGAAANVKDTKWCKPQEGRLSLDGTHEFLSMIINHPRVHVIWKKPLWDGKVEMVNAPLYTVNGESVLLQCDADEIWTAEQIKTLVQMFEGNQRITQAAFFCRYFVGQNIVTTTENAYGNNPGEWLRAWRIWPGDRFLSHEPPRLRRSPDDGYIEEVIAQREHTRDLGLVFDHYSYAFPNQVAYKEGFYGYTDALTHWGKLQLNGVWPVKLKQFLPWVDNRATADVLK
jgi:hypothetical protein